MTTAIDLADRAYQEDMERAEVLDDIAAGQAEALWKAGEISVAMEDHILSDTFYINLANLRKLTKDPGVPRAILASAFVNVIAEIEEAVIQHCIKLMGYDA